MNTLILLAALSVGGCEGGVCSPINHASIGIAAPVKRLVVLQPVRRLVKAKTIRGFLHHPRLLRRLASFRIRRGCCR